MLLAAWRYRFFIISSIKTELRTKFIRSQLGELWMILKNSSGNIVCMSKK